MSHAVNSPLKYAESLLLMAEASDRVTQIEADLSSMAAAIHDNPDLMRFLSDTFIKTEGKQEALAEIFSGRADPLLVMFIRILQIEGKLASIQEISRHFAALAAARQNRVSGELVSAIELPLEKIAEIEKQISLVLGKDVSLTHQLDPDMLGGIIVRVGDFVVDGSLETELSRARSELTG
jgi:F-type H+-transporting ATPase subunit delta